jgi:hypothetical protein
MSEEREGVGNYWEQALVCILDFWVGDLQGGGLERRRDTKVLTKVTAGRQDLQGATNHHEPPLKQH